MSTIRFETRLYTIGSWTILGLPKDASSKLPSRGQVMARGTLNGVAFETPLEPDGRWSHWFTPAMTLLEAAGVGAGDTVAVDLELVKTWPEPVVPTDIDQALEGHAAALKLWEQITPMARWEWVRWIRSTGNTQTRQHRIEVACSKLEAGERRPCCWNRSLCTEPAVSKSGVLLDPTPADITVGSF